MTKLKVCGITRLEDARYVVAAGATHLGFIQDESSDRYISPARTREIVDWVYGAEPVGVFVDASSDDVNRISEASGFKIVQLHGTETPAYCADIELPIIKVISVTDETSVQQLQSEVDKYAGSVDWYLIDTARSSASRKAFNWKLIDDIEIPHPYFLAGGINATNLKKAITEVKPGGLDISSGLESAPGIKDFDKIDAFIELFRQAHEE